MADSNTITQEPWTEEEAAAFAQTLLTFQEGLPPRQREVFTTILANADPNRANGDDVQGYNFAVGVAAGLTVLALDKAGIYDRAKLADYMMGKRS